MDDQEKKAKADARTREAAVADLAEEMFLRSQYGAVGSMTVSEAFERAERFIERREERWEALK